MKKVIKGLKPEYKQIKMSVPHCPICQEQLSGNNSLFSPWRCSCGVWKPLQDNPFNFEIKNDQKTN